MTAADILDSFAAPERILNTKFYDTNIKQQTTDMWPKEDLGACLFSAATNQQHNKNKLKWE